MKARRDFCDTARTFGDDDEIDDDQNDENDDADDEIATHHEIAEGFDYVTRRRAAFMAARENEAR